MLKQKLSITQLLYDHIFVRVPKGGEASIAFSELQKQSESANIECSWGFAEELTTNEYEYIYYPKSFSKKGMYNDPAQDVDTLTKIQLHLSELLKNSHHYTMVEHHVKEMTGKSEVELFMCIESFGSALFTNKRAYNKGHMEMEEGDFASMQQNLVDMQMATLPLLKPFGLDVTAESIAQDRTQYDKWYKHWKTWMESFSDEEWRKVDQLLCNNEPELEQYLPKNKWNES